MSKGVTVLVSIVDDDALVLKHQAITTHNTDKLPFVPHQFRKEWLLLKFIHLVFKIHFEEEKWPNHW